MKFFAIGASRNIGYYSALRLLGQGHQVVFLLRKTNVFDDDAAMKPHIDSGSAKLVKGDALVETDMTAAWEAATSDGPIDVVIFTVGGVPSFSITKLGAVLDRPDLCSTALLNTFSTMPKVTAGSIASSPQPRFIIITSNGVTKDSHAKLPYLMRPVYAMLESPHADKIGMERICHYSAGWASEWKEDGPSEVVLASGWESKLPGKGWLKHMIVVRPAFLTDGQAVKEYRVGEQLEGVYTVSLRDVAHFIAGDLLDNWEKYDGKAISIGN
ncbi:hypothetical protein FRB94_010549 [Tulasnella sp. JGI-2019a]|nr:hypothetical protein FRB94_010549 [Tulasnella sp. JGI-2019a]KAG9039078.1 hypothetical protein FRB95_012789 [Tulasnella sp. JGI-2019a]